MSTPSSNTPRHVIAALVTNEPGVLAQVAGMFAARGFNIDSLVVGRTENPEISRMTIVVSGDNAVLEQVRKQLQKLVPVMKVVDYGAIPYVERDLMLVQVSTAGAAHGAEGSATPPPAGDAAMAGEMARRRGEIIQLANLFRAKVVDVSAESVMIELSGTEDKIEAFIKLVAPYGVVELARTGVIAMPRGEFAGQRGLEAAGVISPAAAAASSSLTIDPGDLPPG